MKINKEINMIDHLRVFLKLNKTPGRGNISKKLDIGEGIIRRVLDELKAKGLIIPTNKGHKYSDKGKKIFDSISGKIMIKNNVKLDLFPGMKNTAIHIKDHNDNSINFKIRDVAIRNQAEGAMIFLYHRHKLELPDCDYSDESFNKLAGVFDFKDGDVLVTTFSKEQKVSEKSAFAVAISLSKSLEKFKDMV